MSSQRMAKWTQPELKVFHSWCRRISKAKSLKPTTPLTRLQVDQDHQSSVSPTQEDHIGDDLPRKVRLADGRTAYLLWYFAGSGSSVEPEPHKSCVLQARKLSLIMVTPSRSNKNMTNPKIKAINLSRWTWKLKRKNPSQSLISTSLPVVLR